jgi:N-acetylneuraminic acid mutarotase
MQVRSRPWGLVVLAIALATLASLCLGNVGAAHAATTTTATRPATANSSSTTKEIKPPTCDTPQAPAKPGAFPTAHCDAVPLTDKAGEVAVTPAVDGPPSTALGPTQIQSAYNLPDAGAGETVAIVDAYGYSTAEADLGVFRSYYGLPACTTADGCFSKVDEDGGTNYPPDDDGWSIETSLDLDAVSSACPKCNILLVEADSDDVDDLAQAEDTAASLGAVAISNSYGGDEDPSELSLDAYYDHPGIAVTASAGDSGYGASYPATSPDVTSVGGTLLTADSGTARGWDESVWNDEDGATGSGCSADEPQPSFQQGLATDCPDNRADNDISADAAPASGLGIYNSEALGGWSQYGGTSLSSPLVAAMFALAGKPTPGTYPVTYPYADPSALNDVTSGNDGDCGNVLCQAGPGWDGPTGLGTPDGVRALAGGPSGQVVGTVTDSGSGAGLSGVTVTATAATGDTYTATTNTSGAYDLYAPVGTYTVATTDFGYTSKTATGVTVAENASTTENFAIAAVPRETVSGYVTDGSGHDWPMRAKITVSGYPGGAIYSDPYTGYYSVSLPSGTDYTLQAASADLPGYLGQTETVDVGSAAVRQDIQLDVDSSSCTAPGYAYQDTGATESFTGWTGTAAQDGWSITDNVGNGQTWNFSNDYNMAPPQGGDADFASVQSEYWGASGQQDTSLVSPAVDLSGQADPQIMFDNEYVWFPGQQGTVDLSLDGGTTWSTVWSAEATDGPMSIPIPQAADQSDVRVRFHFTGADDRAWQIDNVLIGSQACVAQPGGLVAGAVTDANTGGVLEGATVTSGLDQTEFGVTSAEPDDPSLGGGYYWLFSSHTGQTAFTATDGQYASTTANVKVPANGVVQKNFKLDAGRLTVSQQSLSMTATLGAAKSKTVTLGNNGTAPLNVSIGTSDAGFTATGQNADSAVATTPKTLVKAHTSVAEKVEQHPARSGTAMAGPRVTAPLGTAANGAWTTVADYPTAVMDDGVADYDGKVYVVGGSDGYEPLASASVFDPATGAWSSIADLPEPLSALTAQFVGSTLYVTGGWNLYGDASQHTYAYDPSTNTWSQVADLPIGVAGAGGAVVDGQLYVVGGCTTGECTPVSSAVYSYDPGNNSWNTDPAYPTAVGFIACGGVDSEVVCAGGVGNSSSTDATYTYAPGDAGWTQKANLPDDAWGAASATANGELDVLGGAVQNGAMLTNQNYGYDPTSNQWTALPDSANSLYRGGATCGIYQVGGDSAAGPSQLVQYLPGYDQCGSAVAWLSANQSTLTLTPGQKATVTVTADSSTVTQPGTYRADLTLDDNSPYATPAPVTVALTVNPPKTWGEIAGTVTDSSGNPIAGATVAICTMYDTQTGTCGPVTYTLQTNGSGGYQLWLDKGFSPLEVIAAKDGYTPILKIAKLTAGNTTTVAFVLNSASTVSLNTVQTYLNNHLHVRTATK